MEPKNQVPNLSAGEVAKSEQLEAIKGVRSLLDDLERHDSYAGCWKQLAKALEDLKRSTNVLAVTAPE